MKIPLSNLPAVRDALDKVNGRALSFTLSLPDVVSAAQEAEQKLAASGVAKAARAGATFSLIPAGPSARAYKHAAKSTRVTMLRGSRQWYLTGVFPATVYPRQTRAFVTAISQAQREIIIAHALTEYAEQM